MKRLVIVLVVAILLAAFLVPPLFASSSDKRMWGYSATPDIPKMALNVTVTRFTVVEKVGRPSSYVLLLKGEDGHIEEAQISAEQFAQAEEGQEYFSYSYTLRRATSYLGRLRYTVIGTLEAFLCLAVIILAVSIFLGIGFGLS